MHWNEWAAVCLIGLASNLDNAGVGLSYGIRKIKITWFANLTIAAVSLVMTYISGAAGNALTHWISPMAGHLIGTAVIIAVGVAVLCQPFLQGKAKQDANSNILTRILRNPEEADFDRSQSINFMESVVLGIALGINALAGGFDAGITHVSIVLTSISVGLFSFVLLGCCEFIGKTYVAKHLGAKATMLAGILLNLIGIHQLF